MSIEWQDIDFPGGFHSHSQVPIRVDACASSFKKMNSDVIKGEVKVEVSA